jgi:hypothetical protein
MEDDTENDSAHHGHGECLHVDGRQVRRILDLDHNTTLSQLTSALKCLGKELVIDIRDAA